MYRSEFWTTNKRLHVAKMQIICEVTRLNKIRDEYISGTMTIELGTE